MSFSQLRKNRSASVNEGRKIFPLRSIRPVYIYIYMYRGREERSSRRGAEGPTGRVDSREESNYGKSVKRTPRRLKGEGEEEMAT